MVMSDKKLLIDLYSSLASHAWQVLCSSFGDRELCGLVDCISGVSHCVQRESIIGDRVEEATTTLPSLPSHAALVPSK